MGKITFFDELPEVMAAFSMRGDDSQQVRRDLADQGLVVVRPTQIHKDSVGLVTEKMKNVCEGEGEDELVISDTDAVITGCSGVALTTVHADCIPVWLYDEKSGAMGVAHAGWRGTCAGIAAKTAVKMVRNLGASLETMRAAIGPGISLCCFEAGPEVYEAFAARYDFTSEYAVKKENGKYHLDLKQINRRQLEVLGISKIEVSSLCTVCSRTEKGEPLFYSYRRDNGMKGRLVASIYRKG